ncbi:MAG: putative N-acetylmuramoyl-L-alanine amidase, partial [Geminicoccaceae bacterium]|nr:putative N-acetylmuramoyl-L-alanine amidase [Geminicoccaceae bacterium]
MFVFRPYGRAPWLLMALGCSRQSDPQHTQASHEGLTRSELHATSTAQDPVGLRVVYPARTDVVRVRDSSFLFGSVARADTRVTINGHPVRVWSNGAWLAWVPFPPDTLMTFRIEARTANDTSVIHYPVRRDR